MRQFKFNLIIFTLIIFSLISLGFSANLEVFTKYNTDITIYKNNTFEIEKSIALRNVHDVGIVPGEIQFKIYNPAENKDVNISKIDLTDRYGNNIKYNLLHVDDGYVIVLNIFTPVLPGFEYIINLDITAEYEPTGFFFRNLELPLQENSEIPIKSGKVTVNLPKGYHLTYISFQDNNTVIDGNQIIWEIDSTSPQSVNVEYSSIPLNIFGLKGSVVFWLLINVILITILIIHIRKAIKRNKGGSKRNKR